MWSEILFFVIGAVLSPVLLVITGRRMKTRTPRAEEPRPSYEDLRAGLGHMRDRMTTIAISAEGSGVRKLAERAAEEAEDILSGKTS